MKARVREISARRLANKCFLNLPVVVKRRLFRGGKHFCPICETPLRVFFNFGTELKSNAQCPVCGSLERDRGTWLFMKRQTNLFDQSPKRMLHIAPERSLEMLFRTINGIEYVSADIRSSRAMVKMDITDISCPDDTFDVVYCSHVLEHIPADRRAMQEISRVLKPGGWAMMNVPVGGGPTIEDPAAAPTERERLFGDADHVRLYGDDYKDRLEEAGFTVSLCSPGKNEDEADFFRCGILPRQVIFFCRK